MALSQVILFKKSLSPDIELIIKEQTEKIEQKKDIYYLCKFCKTKITSARYKIKINGKFKHVCANPHGLIFEVGCFSDGKNFIPTGEPTKEFTWFPGYAWQIVVCATCLNHLGWLYTSSESSFLGLILTNLIEEKN